MPALTNAEAEQQVLGAFLLNPEKIEAIDADDLFADPVHERLFGEMRRRQKAGKIVSPVGLKAWAEADPGMNTLGGAAYLARIAGQCVILSDVPSYVDLLADLRDRRRVQDALLAAQEALARGEDDPADIAARLEASVSAQGATRGRKPVSMLAAVTEALADAHAAWKGEAVKVLHTGVPSLDRIVGGFYGGDLCILAGRPSMGKSAVALSMALNVARSGKGVVIASLEMTPKALATRALSEQTSQQRNAVKYSSIRSGEMPDFHMESVVDAAKVVSQLPVHFLPVEYRDTDALYAGVKSAQSRLGNLSLVVVDYLQLLRAPGRSRYEQITEISIALKSLAQRLDVPVMALSQLSRAVEQRDDKRPTLADIRESGQIEQDADSVIFCYRDEYYLEREEPDISEGDAHGRWRDAMERARNRLDLIVAKNRGGAINTARVRFNPALNLIWEG